MISVHTWSLLWLCKSVPQNCLFNFSSLLNWFLDHFNNNKYNEHTNIVSCWFIKLVRVSPWYSLQSLSSRFFSKILSTFEFCIMTLITSCNSDHIKAKIITYFWTLRGVSFRFRKHFKRFNLRFPLTKTLAYFTY